VVISSHHRLVESERSQGGSASATGRMTPKNREVDRRDALSVNQLRERQAARDPPFPEETIELTLRRGSRVLLGREPTALNAPRATPRDAVPIRPQRLPLRLLSSNT
jgi:hypothetical protein